MNQQKPTALIPWAARAAALVCLFAAEGAAQAQPPKFTTIHQFRGAPTDGGHPPYGSSLVGSDGALFGVTRYGGQFKAGTVYSLTPPTSPGEPWSETIIHTFTGGSGGLAGASPVIGRGGAIYGWSAQGPLGYGFVFSLSPPSSPGGTWSFVDIYDFTSHSNEGAQGGPLAVDGSGVIYGTLLGDRKPALGAVYSLTPPVSPGGQWTESVLHTFTGEDGFRPRFGVVLGSGGVLYGTTAGSSNGQGVVFSLAPPSSPGGEWTYTVLAYLSDGSVDLEAGGLVIGAAGVLYGLTNDPPAGSVFSLTPPASQGGAWTYAKLYAFTYGDLGSADGSQPSSLVIGTGGVLYGVTSYGGYDDVVGGGAGTIFSLAPPQSSGGAWTETVLYRFTNGTDGSFPVCVIRSDQDKGCSTESRSSRGRPTTVPAMSGSLGRSLSGRPRLAQSLKRSGSGHGAEPSPYGRI